MHPLNVERLRRGYPSVLLVLSSLLVLGACEGRAPVEPCEPSETWVRSLLLFDKVDLLFVVDNGSSMAEEQESLAEQLPRLVEALFSGDRDMDGIPDVQPVGSLNIGVVSSDMGTGGFTVPTCAEPNFGDDGVLRNTADSSLPGCLPSYPGFLTLERMGSGEGVYTDASTYGSHASCLARIGTDGCGFAQPLEAALKALTPRGSDIRFSMGTVGHGDDPATYRGFLREDSLLVIVLLTDGEDCSVSDPELFNSESAVYGDSLNLRCSNHGEVALHPVSRYVDGLLALRSDPSLLLFAAIAGVPTDLVGGPELSDYPAILGDPRMQDRLNPSCDVPGRGSAFPPRRIVEVARQLEQREAQAIVQSLCQADFTPAIDAILERIDWAFNVSCFPLPLSRNEAGLVACEIHEELPSRGELVRCDQIPGRTRIGEGGTAEYGFYEICRVEQFPLTDGQEPSGPGWYYDDISPEARAVCGARGPLGYGQRLSYTRGAEIIPGARYRIECPTWAYRDVLSVGSPCPAPGTGCSQDEIIDGKRCKHDLTCDPHLDTLQVPCGADEDCPWDFRCGQHGLCTTASCISESG